MSGILQGEPEDLGDGRRRFHFVMDKPVAPYLIAIAAGDIDFAALGPRTGVWAEPAVLPRAAAELADTEAMVAAAEGLYGPYRWGRYDMIVLPPAFPYGGMENPVMTSSPRLSSPATAASPGSSLTSWRIAGRAIW